VTDAADGDSAGEIHSEGSLNNAGEHISDSEKRDTGPPVADSDSFSPV